MYLSLWLLTLAADTQAAPGITTSPQTHAAFLRGVHDLYSTTIDKHGSPTCFDAVRVRLTIPEATRTLD
jgi:hypothetical protein